MSWNTKLRSTVKTTYIIKGEEFNSITEIMKSYQVTYGVVRKWIKARLTREGESIRVIINKVK